MHKKITMRLLRVSANVGLCAGLLFATQYSSADVEKPDVASFFANPLMSNVELSPDGKFVAMLVGENGGRRKLATMNVESKQFKVIQGFSNADIVDVHWVNNDRLTFSMEEPETAQGTLRFYPGLFSVNRDGSDMRTLIDPNPREANTVGSHIVSKALPGRTFFYDVDRSNGSDDVFVWQPVDKSSTDWDIKAVRLMKLNTRTGHYETIDRAGDTIEWLIDQNGVPRLNVTENNGMDSVFYLDPTDDKWRKIAEFQSLVNGKGGFYPRYFGPDGGLYVTAYAKSGDEELYRFDLTKNAIDPHPVIGVKGYDFGLWNEGNAHFDEQFIVNSTSKKLLGVNYQTDASATYWFDDDMKKIQKAVDALLPATANMLSIGRSGDTRNVLVRAYSDVQPEMYLLYDSSAGKIVVLGKSHPEVNSKQMSQQDMVHYKTRDGMDIPAYLTLPRGASKKNLPLVVLVHGGPWVRGAAWGWDPEVQFLASRGYAVLQPEFRGSVGYGDKLYRAGWKQWGLAMQDDVADATQWAIAQGYVDPKRICIAGASYGGYATLMGLAKNPELFHCGFEWVGVTDLALRYADDWRSDSTAEGRNYELPVLVGDPVKDAEMLKVNSPVNNASRVTQPLLMAYGGSDRRVPIEHGEKFRDAVKPFNKNVEWVVYPDEGHGWYLLKDNVDFWTRVEKFLDANIGKAAPAQGVATN